MSELDDLRSFVEAAGAGGFSRAAARLGVSKSIVSRRIARLETELGTQLLSRTTRGVRPTEVGLEFKARAEKVLADLDEAREAVARHDEGLHGRMRIAAPLEFGVRYVAPLLAEMALRHPELEMDVSYGDRIVDLVGEGFDAAIRIGTLRDSSLVARRIASVNAAIVASPAYLEAHGIPRAPEDLSRHACLIYSGATSRDLRFRAGKRWISVRPQGRLRADSGEAIVCWAIAGLGIASLPTFVCGDAIREGRLVPLLTDYPMADTALHVVRPPGPYTSRKVRALIDAAVQHFGGDRFWDPCRRQLPEAPKAA